MTERIRSVRDLVVYKKEASETQTWLEFSHACRHVDDQTYKDLYEEYEQIFAMLHAMGEKASAFCNKG